MGRRTFHHWLWIWGVGTTLAAAGLPGVAVAEPPLPPVVTSVRELRSQDQALSLAVEAFRQVQSSLIERDFHRQIAEARRHSNREAQYAGEALAEFQRFWRVRRLGTQVRNLLLTYEYARRSDERLLGVSVPSEVDLERASRQVRELIPAHVIAVEAPVFECALMSRCELLLADMQLAVPGRLTPSVTVGKVFARYGEHLATLHEINGGNDQLLNAVIGCLSESNALAVTGPGPIILATTFRPGPRGINQVCVQTIARHAPPTLTGSSEAKAGPTGRPGTAMVRDLATDWFDLLHSTDQQWFGVPAQVKLRQRAFQQLLEGNLTFFREQTVEPMRLYVTLPQPHYYLPVSLRKRVTAVALEADFDLTDWRLRLHLLTGSTDDAERVALTVAAWRDVLLTTLRAPEDDEMRGALTEAVRRGRLEVGERSVTIGGVVPARVATRSAQRALRWATSELP